LLGIALRAGNYDHNRGIGVGPSWQTVENREVWASPVSESVFSGGWPVAGSTNLWPRESRFDAKEY
jgi:hypothetical protein